jgi:hypothetical protein
VSFAHPPDPALTAHLRRTLLSEPSSSLHDTAPVRGAALP